jgi:hypothetical protein
VTIGHTKGTKKYKKKNERKTQGLRDRGNVLKINVNDYAPIWEERGISES